MHRTALPGGLARREILEWRDRHKLASALGIARCWQDLKPSVNERIEEIGWYDATVSPSAFIEKEIDPVIIEGIGTTVELLIGNAQDELRQIGEHQLGAISTLGNIKSDPITMEDATEVLSGIAPLAGGLALGAALPGMAVVSGSALFGLIATSTVSMPIVLTGVLVAGGAVATGAVKTSQFRDYRIRAIRKRIEDHVAQSVLSTSAPSNASATPSVLFAIHQALDEAANVAVESTR